MAKCVVIGGGFAGLASSAFLTKNNIEVTLFESSPKLGGRAYSLKHKSQNDFIDNGQHILMGCYNYTLQFLKLINAEKYFYRQHSLKMNFRIRGGKNYLLDASTGFYPLNLLIGILRFNLFDYREKIEIIKFFIRLAVQSRKIDSGLTVYEWLKKEKQSDEVIKKLWNVLAVGALNTDLQLAAASAFKSILKELFLNGNKASTLIIPVLDLTSSYVIPAKHFIEENGGEIFVSEPVLELITENDKINAVRTSRRLIKDVDCVISAVPFYSFQKFENILVNNNLDNNTISFSPILSVHLWLNKNPFTKLFYGLIDSPIHWLFNHESHITLVTSNATEFLNIPYKKILNDFISELSLFFPEFNKADVIDHQIIMEKRATFVPTINFEEQRAKIKSPLKNLFLAGDWVNTGLPSTIESAVKSGKIASSKALEYLKNG